MINSKNKIHKGGGGGDEIFYFYIKFFIYAFLDLTDFDILDNKFIYNKTIWL